MKLNSADMDVDIPVLEGHLNVPNQSGFPLNRISKKKACHRYCLLFKSSRYGIERLEICENKEDKSPKIITLENCVKITQEPAPSTSIQIVKKTGTLTLTALTEDDQKAWVNALQTVAFRDKATNHAPQAAIEEDNDLYSSSYADGFFLVKLIPTETSIRCNIEPTSYMLHLSATELQLKSQDDVIKAKWPYRFIRKYGYRDGKFTFEAGRKCLTGEGMFTLYHVNPQEVFRCMSAKMKSMKKLISGESMNSIDCAIASMEPGSRSPVPPSPSKQGAEFEMNSAASIRGLLSSSDSLNNFSMNSNCTTSNNNSISSLLAAKQIPHKPPRKLPVPMEKLNLVAGVAPNHKPMATPPNTLDLKTVVSQLNCDQYRKFQNYEPVQITTGVDGNKNVSATVTAVGFPENNNKRLNIPPSLPLRNDNSTTPTLPTMSGGGERDYECIQNITDAWKTLGVGNVNHNERTVTTLNNEEDIIEFMLQQRSKSKVTDLDQSDVDNASTEGNYDRLDFLTPNNKTSSGYKTIVTVSSTRGRCSPPPSNEYELIASPDIQSYRKADDSYLGYGVVRKSTTSGEQQQPQPQQQPYVTTTAAAAAATTTITSITPTQRPAAKLGVDNVLEHRNYNEVNYTVVSKPKSV